MEKVKNLKSSVINPYVLALIVLSFLAVLFAFIATSSYLAFNELRTGYKLYDPLITWIPPVNLSSVIFISTYSCIIIGLVYSLSSPEKIIRTNLAILSLLIYRMVCMYLVPLEPPEGIIPLKDMFLELTTYDQKVILKDLFFSGHTASVALLFHLVENKTVSRIMLAMSMIIGSMLIIQHVHYTVDVLVAYAFAHLAYLTGFWVSQKSLVYSRFMLIKTSKQLS